MATLSPDRKSTNSIQYVYDIGRMDVSYTVPLTRGVGGNRGSLPWAPSVRGPQTFSNTSGFRLKSTMNGNVY